MKNDVIYFCVFSWILFSLGACKIERSDKSFLGPVDLQSAARGRSLFTQYCGACHNFNFDGIGPKLGGITDSVPMAWLTDFIRNPKKMIDSGDARANRLFTRHKSIMPPFAGLGDSSIYDIIAYLGSRKPAVLSTAYHDRMEVKNPIPDTIELSDVVVELKLIAEFPVTGTPGVAPLARIAKLDVEPHSGQSFVLDMNGILYKMNKEKPEVYMDISKHVHPLLIQPGLSSGFANFAFHPEFHKNGLLYTAHSVPAATRKADFSFEDSLESAMQFVIMEWKTADPKESIFKGTGRELFRIDMVSKAHGIQEIAFNPTAQYGEEDFGLLYIAIGDAGAGENRYPFLLHSKKRAWGTVMRIDPNKSQSSSRLSKNGQYGIPRSNPFVSDSHAIAEIYAFGFRNPHRITWTKKGQLLVSNIGHGDIEALDLVEPGQDYGWPYMEGRFMVDPFGDLSKIYDPIASDGLAKKVSLPVAQFDHDEAKAITGGYEYLGSIPELKGKFLFGDIPVGNLYFVYTDDIQTGKSAKIFEWRVALNGQIIRLKDLNKKDRIELHFGRDAKGEMYLMTKADGKLYKIIRTVKETTLKGIEE